ncbi:hypothetical protein N8482_01445 [Chitinophagales bacterium]|nr:hypothetical protein [Chitinophagales bacterium]
MKLLKLSFLFAIAIAFTSCGDDAGDCVAADWVGTYNGTYECDDATEAEDVVVTITASGTDAILVTYETDTVVAEWEAITPDGCAIDESDSQNGITLTIDASLDGDNLSFTDVLSGGGSSVSCSITATRN